MNADRPQGSPSATGKIDNEETRDQPLSTSATPPATRTVDHEESSSKQIHLLTEQPDADEKASAQGLPPTVRAPSHALDEGVDPKVQTLGVAADDVVRRGATVPRVGYRDIFLRFVWLGWAAFGGPAAHIALFQKVFVDQLGWIPAAVYLELLGLSQCLPGPTSTQVSFALGVVWRGVKGGLLSGILFQYPGFLIAALVGAGAANVLKNPAPWLHGLTSGLAAVGVALVASAAKGLTYGTCKDRALMIINAVAAIVSFYYPKTWIFPALILAGGLVMLVILRKQVFTVGEAERVVRLGVSRAAGAVLVAAWLAVLVGTIVARRRIGYANHKPLFWWEAFFRTGSIIFGGGQVVLPLLQTEVVATGWVSEQDFLTGLALIQAMPGPLFNFAAYLGAIIAYNAGWNMAAGIFTCWVALFAPGILLIYGIMPWWGRFRSLQVYRRMLPGLNAAAVGLIVGAVFSLGLQIWRSSPFPATTICIGIIGFALVDFVGCPTPLAVALGGACGVIGWAARMH